MADKLRTQQQLESLQNKYVGTGHADTTKFEFASNMKRDSNASFVGHPPMLEYMAVGNGISRERMRVMMIDAMIRPVGPPPEDQDPQTNAEARATAARKSRKTMSKEVSKEVSKEESDVEHNLERIMRDLEMDAQERKEGDDK